MTHSKGAEDDGRFESHKDKPVELRGVDPLKPFYLVLSAAYPDGSLSEIGSEGCEGNCETEAEAIRIAKEVNQTYHTLECYVYLVKPIAKVERSKPKVSRL